MIIASISFCFFLVIELILFTVRSQVKSKNKKQTLECLFKMVEYNVLNATLNNPITSEQALGYEYNKTFIKIEFLEAKPYLGYLFDLSESITVGRDRENKIVIRDDNVSRIHCKFYMMNGQVFIQDLNSTNGTVIKGKWFSKVKLQPQNIVSLREEDRVIVGGYAMRVSFLSGSQVRK